MHFANHCKKFQWKQFRELVAALQYLSSRLSVLNRTVSGVWDMASNWLASRFVTGYSKYSLGLLSAYCIMGSLDQWEFPPFFRAQWQPRCSSLTAGKCLPLGLCKGTVKDSKTTDVNSHRVTWKSTNRNRDNTIELLCRALIGNLICQIAIITVIAGYYERINNLIPCNIDCWHPGLK